MLFFLLFEVDGFGDQNTCWSVNSIVLCGNKDYSINIYVDCPVKKQYLWNYYFLILGYSENELFYFTGVECQPEDDHCTDTRRTKKREGGFKAITYFFIIFKNMLWEWYENVQTQLCGSNILKIKMRNKCLCRRIIYYYFCYNTTVIKS